MPEDENEAAPENTPESAPEEAPESAPESAQPPEDAVKVSDKGGVPEFQDLKGVTSGEVDPQKVNFLFDIMLDVNIELGRANLKVKDILGLAPGSVVELNRLAGDPVEVLVNNKLVAKGEVIVIDENFAIRITDIISSKDIVSTLGA